jgi:hypothetical protein
VMRRRREFFRRPTEEMVAFWWVPEGETPSVADAEERLRLLRGVGPSRAAFTFRRSFPPPGEAPVAVDDERELCPAG